LTRGGLIDGQEADAGPKAYKVGRWLKYDPADIVAWLQSQAA
jgi:hypothetical protein